MSAKNPTPTRKSPLRLLFGVGLLLFGATILYSGVSGLFNKGTELIAPNGVLTIETVDTPEARTKGLSGKESISDAYGMLFVFDTSSAEHCLVMRDMLISIDMVWLNEDKQVIALKQAASPESYPEIFCPDGPAKYALEINANRAEELGIEPGTYLKF